MKKFMIALFSLFAASATCEDIILNGAGATFPAPVYRVWSYNFSESTDKQVIVNYQSLGSGAGINQIKAGTVAFGASDNPLNSDELAAAGLFQFPMLTGGVVVVANLPGVKNNTLKLDNIVLADIFLGKIKTWNDPRIEQLNPGVKLPKLKITVVSRSDSSGTTFIFTNYLSKISEEWRDKVGCAAAVKFPVGIGGQKNPGVCNNVARIKGSIGYTEYTYAIEAKLSMTELKNKAGVFVAPSPESFAASAENANWADAPGFYMILTDQEGEKSWPITGVTYVLVRRDTPQDVREALNKYFSWCFSDGAMQAIKLNYVPIPENVVEFIKKEWADVL